MLTNILLGSLLLLLLVVSISFAVLISRTKRVIASFFIPDKEGEASPFAKGVDVVSGMIARALVAQLKTVYMGERSGAVRSEKAIQGDLALDLAGQNPALSTLLGAFPNLSKTLRRNPGLLDLAMGIMSRRSQSQASPGSAATPGSNGSGVKPQFKI